MMDGLWSLFEFDTLDYVIIIGIVLTSMYFLFNNSSSKITSGPKSTPITPSRPAREQGFIAKMKNEGRQVLILYGSQTGTAEELSGRLSKDLHRYSQKALVIDPEEIDVDDLVRLPEIDNILLILCVATYGEGDPTDNAQQMFDFFKNTDASFKGVKYAVFGLGNKTYEHFNEVGKVLDVRLDELGAERVFALGLGDDDANLEEDFMRWREAFLPNVAQEFGWELNSNAENQRQYRLEILEKENVTAIFKGEYGRLGAFEKQRPPFDLKNPFLAQIEVNRELHTSESERSCRHIELSIKDSRIRYESGDHVAIFPQNDVNAVDYILKRIGTDEDTIFRLINTDEESSKRSPFPCPTTLRTAFTCYVDIASPLKSHLLKALAEFCTDDNEKERLKLISTPSEEGLKEYASFIVKGRRGLADVLKAFPSCQPTFDYLLELLPRLQARYYSIASSPKKHDSSIHITAVVTEYSIKDSHDERFIKGVCTNWVKEKMPNEKVPIFVRKSQMRLPNRSTLPLILIGPGTGFAPFRGFIQERAWAKSQEREIGELMLFFGCRHPNKDYIYQDELEKYSEDGVITDLNVAFSRYEKQPKTYVQDLIWAKREHIWKLISNGAHIYVCGDARNMAKDVQSCILKVIRENGGQSDEEAQKFFKDMERQRRYQADVWS